jgi:hypothetical protein
VYRGVLELDVVLWHEEESGPEGGGKTGSLGGLESLGSEAGKKGKLSARLPQLKRLVSKKMTYDV